MSGAETVSSSVIASTSSLKSSVSVCAACSVTSLASGRPEAGGGDLYPVPAVGQIRDDVDPCLGRGRLRLDVGLDVGGDDRHAGEHAAGRVGDRAVELRSRDLCRSGGAHRQEAEGRDNPDTIRRGLPHLAPPDWVVSRRLDGASSEAPRRRLAQTHEPLGDGVRDIARGHAGVKRQFRPTDWILLSGTPDSAATWPAAESAGGARPGRGHRSS